MMFRSKLSCAANHTVLGEIIRFYNLVKPCLMHITVQPCPQERDKLSPTLLLEVKDKEEDLLTRMRQRKLSLKGNLVTPNRPH